VRVISSSDKDKIDVALDTFRKKKNAQFGHILPAQVPVGLHIQFELELETALRSFCISLS
jgi:hypothetical protein